MLIYWFKFQEALRLVSALFDLSVSNAFNWLADDDYKKGKRELLAYFKFSYCFYLV